MRLNPFAILFAALLAAFAGQSLANELDHRYYLMPALGYVLNDNSRQIDDGAEGSVIFGRSMNDIYNLEAVATYTTSDVSAAGQGEASSYGLGVGIIAFLDRGQSPLYSLFRLQYFTTNNHPGAEADGPAADGGLGLWYDIGERGAFRAELGLRLTVHSEAQAGNAGKNIFNDQFIRAGYAFALGRGSLLVPPKPEPVQVASGSDSDGDGVLDEIDLCPGTPYGTAVDEFGCALATAPVDGDCRPPLPGESVDEYGCAVDASVVLNKVNFKFDSAELLPEAFVILEDVALVLKASPQARVEIGGHTSSEGGYDYNVGLSKRRARSVRDFLVSRGIAPESLAIRGYGPDRPIASNDTEAGRSKNRRVEVGLVSDVK